MGSFLAMEAVHLITGMHAPATLGRSLTIDLRTWRVEEEASERHPGCDVCRGAHR